MINFSKLLGLVAEEKNTGTLEQKLAENFNEFPDNRVSYLTGLVGLLGKVAFCDMEISDEELEAIEKILTTEGQLAKEEAAAVCQLLSSVTPELAGVEDFRYSRIINEALPKLDDRREFLTVLFEVAAADKGISASEDHVIGQIANTLRLTRQDFINVRLRFKEELTLFQGSASD